MNVFHLALAVPVMMQAAPPAASAVTPAPPIATATAAIPGASPTPSGAPTGASSKAPSGRVLHLDEVVQVAIKSQPLMHEARAQTEGAIGASQQARAGLLPQVSGSALYERAYSSSFGSAGTGSTTGTNQTGPPTTGGTPTGVATANSGTGSFVHNVWSFNANATQLIYDFNQTPDKFSASKRNVESLRATERTTELQVLLGVRRSFFTARATHALVRVADETLTNEQKHLTQIEGFVRAGTHPEIDVVQERTTLANDRVALINAQNNYEIAKAQLNQSMGVVGDTNYDVADDGLPPLEGEDGADESLVQYALKTRPELVAYQKTREANELTVKAYKGAYGPTLSALGTAGESGLALDSLAPSWAVGAQLLWPFFQGGLTRGQVHQAEANLSYTDAQLEAEQLQVRFDVQQAVLTLRAAKATIEASNEALTNAREQLRLAEGRYQSGVGSIIELGDAQVAATNAAAQVVQADFNLATARAQLLTALGRP